MVLDEKGLDAFSEICTDVLDKHGPQRKRYLRLNHKPFMNNEISKAIMTRTRLRNRFLKKQEYSKQRSISQAKKFMRKSFEET